MTERKPVTAEAVRASLETVIDPKMKINVVDLGTVVDVRIEEGRIEIDMTLTNPDEPTVGMLASEIEQTVRSTFDEIEHVEVGVVLDPPWTLARMSEKAKAKLGHDG